MVWDMDSGIIEERDRRTVRQKTTLKPANKNLNSERQKKSHQSDQKKDIKLDRKSERQKPKSQLDITGTMKDRWIDNQSKTHPSVRQKDRSNIVLQVASGESTMFTDLYLQVAPVG